MRVLVNECLDLFSGEALLGFVCWRLMLISPAWAGVGQLGFGHWWTNAWIYVLVKHGLDLCLATDANVATVGWCRQAWTCVGGRMIGFVLW